MASSRLPLSAFAVIALLGLAAACNSSEISAGDYDASCSADSDCVTATFGDVCALNCNPNGAIRRSEEARYLADYKEKSAGCPQIAYFQDPCTGAYRTFAARCAAGRCAAAEITDAGADTGP